MHWGFGMAHLSTDEFWALTPREVAAAFRLPGRGDAPARSTLDALMRQFPDQQEEAIQS
ncbi:phage tail assembly chaperone [Coralliovum pocilloporae]|uniref:phage tail assembly chaperone n=1 Tax=Coralliovum pocilloporae TaxID=3066369 RepID=UPI003306DDF0